MPPLLKLLATEATVDVANRDGVLPTLHNRLPGLRVSDVGHVVRFVRETNRQIRLFDSISDTVFHPVAVPDPAAGGAPDLRFRGSTVTLKGRLALQRIQGGGPATRAAAEALAARFNEQTRFLNHRVFDVLKVTTGEDGDEPRFWWDWWNRYSDIEAPYKYVVKTERYEKPLHVPVRISCSCFVAGTPVVTKSGVRAIEKLRIGDRVLSQDPETGELGFRVVLRTTTRQPPQTVE